MSSRAVRCQGCGGPLPEAPQDGSTITCPFCGIVNEAAARPSVTVKLDVREAAAHLGSRVKLAIGLGLAGVALVVAFGVLRAVRPITDALDEVRQQSDAMKEAIRPLAPAELTSLTEGGWRHVQAQPPPSGWTAFDPVVGMEWASGIARAWAADAVLTRLEVTRVAADGTLDLTGSLGDAAEYQFVSPSRIADWEHRANREVDARAVYGLTMRVAEQHVTANVRRGRPRSSTPLPPADTLPLRDVFSRARKQPSFAEHPFYTGQLTYLPKEGWVWHFQSLSQRERIPRVRARDGRVFPYR
jgi:hypothetical protein